MIIKTIIDNWRNTDYHFMAMVASYFVGLFSVNWVQYIMHYLRRVPGWVQDSWEHKQYAQYDFNESKLFYVKLPIRLYICGDAGVDSENKERVPNKQIIKYKNCLDEFLHYQARLTERSLTSDFKFGLCHMVNDCSSNGKRKVKDIMPQIGNEGGQYFGVFKIWTYTDLTLKEKKEITRAIEKNLFDCFGESIEQTTIYYKNLKLQLEYM